MQRIRLMAACSACIVVALTGGASAQDHSHGATPRPASAPGASTSPVATRR
ncbi:hypothetical protein [Brevundimonas aurantiaca]|uniref:hypothetical protein n=1 Tax=Brevundimonas aurantiaca TaxID=74316 RepID=UPI001CD64C82|nr:hypothetical protein [Brevundimonas aurantiaca]